MLISQEELNIQLAKLQLVLNMIDDVSWILEEDYPLESTDLLEVHNRIATLRDLIKSSSCREN